MSDTVRVTTATTSHARGILLVLSAQDGSRRAWSKAYDAPIFPAMDCMDLELVQEGPVLGEDFVVRGRTRLLREGVVSLERVRRCRFEPFQTPDEGR